MVLVATLNGMEWYRGPLSGVSSGIELLFWVSSGIEFFFWALKWYSGTLAETGPEWHYGPFSGISSGIQGALSCGIPSGIQGLEWYCRPSFWVSSGIEGLSPVIRGLLRDRP